MFKEIPLSDLVISNKNVRKSLDNSNEETNLETLAHDIKHNGLINPLSVRKIDNGKYEIYAGQRRFMALKRIKSESALCSISSVDDNKAELISLSENLQRNKMSQLDKCEAFYKLYLMYNQDVNQVAKRVSYANYTIKDYITVKENLTSELFKNLDEKGDEKLSMELAVYLCKHISKEKQHEVWESIKTLGTIHLKKQAIAELSEEKDKDELPGEEGNEEDAGDDKEEELGTKEKKPKIPNKPWVWDEDQNPLVIPENLHFHVLQLVRQNT